MAGSPDVARVVGYFPLPDRLMCMAWVKQAKTSLLLLSLASDNLMGVLPDLSQAHEGELVFQCPSLVCEWADFTDQHLLLGCIQLSPVFHVCAYQLLSMQPSATCHILTLSS